jgi:tetratricopeptide (TPR) repeat protein
MVKTLGSRRVLGGMTLAAVLMSASFTAHADMSACSSAYVKSDPDEAIRLYTRCITGGDMSKGNLSGAFTNRGVLYMSKGEYDKAFSDLTSAIHFNPRAGLAHFNRAQINGMRGDSNAAFDDLTAAIKFAPSRVHARAYSQRAYINYGRDNCAAALKDIDAALVRAPKQAQSYSFKAWILATCQSAGSRNGAEALTASQKAVGLKDYWEAHQAMAAAYAELGRFDEAVAEMQIAKDQAQKTGAWQSRHEGMMVALKEHKQIHASGAGASRDAFAGAVNEGDDAGETGDDAKGDAR